MSVSPLCYALPMTNDNTQERVDFYLDHLIRMSTGIVDGTIQGLEKETLLFMASDFLKMLEIIQTSKQIPSLWRF